MLRLPRIQQYHRIYLYPSPLPPLNMTETFHWEHKGLDRCRFEAYTKLLRLRHGGQASDPVSFASSTEGIEEDEPSDDVDSVKGQPLAIFDDEKLKRAFLDRLSELMSPAKGGHQVAATLMIQSQNRAEITVARNCGFKENDKTFLKQLQCILVNISRRGSKSRNCHNPIKLVN